jgi:hypothetical protein
MRSSLWLADCEQPAGPALTAGPYVLNGSGGKATVRFKTGAAGDFSVRLLKSDGVCAPDDVFNNGIKVSAALVDANRVPYVDAETDPVPGLLYSADFELEPSETQARYCYGISFPKKPWAETNRYYCQPDLTTGFAGTSFMVPPTRPEPFSFYVYGDVRFPSGFSMIHLEVTGRMALEIEDDLAAKREPASFLVHTGDFAYYGCDVELWADNMWSPGHALFQQLPILPAPGNHEQYSEADDDACKRMPFYFGFFGSMYQHNSSLPPGMYAVDYSNTRFISLNLWDTETTGGMARTDCSSEQMAMPCADVVAITDTKLGTPPTCGYRWLQCQLQPEDSKGIDHIFIFHHAPAITAPPSGKHGSSDFQVRQLAPLWEKPDGTNPSKVVAVLNGHNHLYERSAPLMNLCLKGDPGCDESAGLTCAAGPYPVGFDFPSICYTTDDSARTGITYLISGGGGAEPYRAPAGPFPIDWLENAANAYGYSRIMIDGKRVTLETKGFYADGRVFEDHAVLRD